MTFRLYYNRSEDLPRVWSFDEGTQESEQVVAGFVIHEGCLARGRTDFSAPRVSKEVLRAWVEIACDHMLVREDVVHFYSENEGSLGV